VIELCNVRLIDLAPDASTIGRHRRALLIQ